MGQAISRPEGETERLVAVRSIMSFKNAEMPELKVLSQLGQGVFGVARAAVNIVDEDWLHIAEQAGMELSECPRDLSICNRVIAKQDVVVISDLTEHPHFRFMSYVKGGRSCVPMRVRRSNLSPVLLLAPFVWSIRCREIFPASKSTISDISRCWRLHCYGFRKPISP